MIPLELYQINSLTGATLPEKVVNGRHGGSRHSLSVNQAMAGASNTYGAAADRDGLINSWERAIPRDANFAYLTTISFGPFP